MNPGATQLPSARPGGFATEPHRVVTAPLLPARRIAKGGEALIVGLLCLGALCLFYFEVVFENRTFLPFGSPGEVMGGAPPWHFTGTIRANPYRLDGGGSAWQLEPWARTVAASYKSLQL